MVYKCGVVRPQYLIAWLWCEPGALCTLVLVVMFSYKFPEPCQIRFVASIVGVEKPSPLGLSIEFFPKQFKGFANTIQVRLVRRGVAKGHEPTSVSPDKPRFFPKAVI